MTTSDAKTVVITSGVASVGNPGPTAYGGSKGAVESFTRSLRHELRHEAVHCTLIQPRLASTESTNPVIYTDWVTRIGLTVARLFPSIVRRGTERFLTDRT
jgi:short-subunit dehydrogenase